MFDSMFSSPAATIVTPAANMVTTSHTLLADPRLRAGVAVAIPCIVLAFAWRHFRGIDQDNEQTPLPAKSEKPKAKDPVRQQPPPPPSDSEKPKRKAAVRELPPTPVAAPAPAFTPLLPPFSPERPGRNEADVEHKDTNPVFEQPSYFEQDSASVNSGSSTEHHKHRKLRVGKNLKRAWSKRPFANGGAEQHAQSPISPLSAE